MPNEFVDLSRRNIRVWFLLAFQAGAVNAGGFLACGRFVTHTTGFATHFAVELATHHEGAALGILSVPIFFLLGAMFTAFFVEHRLLHRRPANYAVPTFLIFLLLSAAMVLGRFGMLGNFNQELEIRHDYLLLVLLSFASGLQNALITNSQGVVVRTTHMTGMTTDLAVGLVRSIFREPGESPARLERDRQATFARAGIIASFIAGSTVSAYLYLRGQWLGFAVPVLTSLILLRYFVLRTREKWVSRGDETARESPGHY
jgi:uncharacterized membrane protein YoaK (UPF0700 family)